MVSDAENLCIFAVISQLTWINQISQYLYLFKESIFNDTLELRIKYKTLVWVFPWIC